MEQQHHRLKSRIVAPNVSVPVGLASSVVGGG